MTVISRRQLIGGLRLIFRDLWAGYCLRPRLLSLYRQLSDRVCGMTAMLASLARHSLPLVPDCLSGSLPAIVVFTLAGNDTEHKAAYQTSGHWTAICGIQDA